jgi:osmotically inducible protein OsmC
MPVRSAEAEWKGNLREGQGTMRTGSGAYQGAYSFPSRFEEGQGSNPEELIAAAHAGCFSMAFAAGLTRAGFSPTSIRTTAKVHIEQVPGGFGITRIDLETEGQVPGIDNAAFQEQAQAAKGGCPVSKALASVENITLNAKLV